MVLVLKVYDLAMHYGMFLLLKTCNCWSAVLCTCTIRWY